MRSTQAYPLAFGLKLGELHAAHVATAMHAEVCDDQDVWHGECNACLHSCGCLHLRVAVLLGFIVFVFISGSFL